MDNRYRTGQVQINVSNDNSTLNATQTQIINYIESKKIPKMMTPNPVPYSHYVSQGNENKIIEKLQQNKRVFLHGVGGIGKTALAKRIYELVKNKYDHLAWINFKDNWKTSLVDGLFTSIFRFEKNISENEKYNRIIEWFTNLQEEKSILIVVDNFNILENGVLNEILRLPVSILITTRCKFPNIRYNYELTPLDEKYGRELFIQNYETPEMLTFADEGYIKEIVKAFDTLEINDEVKPKVGIVGEILVKYHPTANNNIVDVLEKEGAEVVVPELLDFFLYCCYNSKFKNRYLSGSSIVKTGCDIAISYIESYRKVVIKELQNSERFGYPSSINNLAKKAANVVSLGNQTGEGWLLTGEMVELIESDVNNIVCIQPFACLPNHITGKGMIKALKSKYPLANIVAVDYDPGASEVNQLNRIKLMMSVAFKNLKVPQQDYNYRKEVKIDINTLRTNNI